MTTSTENYFIPEPSRWPIIGATSVFTFLFGTVLWMNTWVAGPWIMVVGLAGLAFLFKGWFGDVISENLAGSYNGQVDQSFRQGMFWFITSEVFFFITFFGCLYYLRTITLPYLGGEGTLGASHMLWEGFTYQWPLQTMPDASNYTAPKEAMGPIGIPLLNTLILLTSGATVTWAHWALKKNDRKQLVWGLLATVVLGFTFLGFQGYEYGHAYHALDLTLNSGIYGSTFYMLTGFHGLHVTIGSLMLLVILIRSIKGDFTPKKHFAFEGVAWYWHFVDVVWLGLYLFVYWM